MSSALGPGLTRNDRDPGLEETGVASDGVRTAGVDPAPVHALSAQRRDMGARGRS